MTKFDQFNPGEQYIASDSREENILRSGAGESLRTANDSLFSLYIKGLMALAKGNPALAFRIYLSTFVSVSPGREVTFEDSSTRLPIDIETPQGRG